MRSTMRQYGYHGLEDSLDLVPLFELRPDTQFTYDFRNFFHPYVSELLEALNKGGVEGMLSPETQSMAEDFFDNNYTVHEGQLVKVKRHRKEIDVDEGGPY